MKYKTVNQIDTICIDEMNFSQIRFEGGRLTLMLDGAVIKADNTHNNRFEDVYGAPMELTFCGVTMERFCLAGYKYYDADGKLLQEIPERRLDEAQMKEIMAKTEGGWVFRLEYSRDGGRCRLIYDTDIQDETNTYEAEFSYESSIASWERFTGPVEGK